MHNSWITNPEERIAMTCYCSNASFYSSISGIIEDSGKSKCRNRLFHLLYTQDCLPLAKATDASPFYPPPHHPPPFQQSRCNTDLSRRHVRQLGLMVKVDGSRSWAGIHRENMSNLYVYVFSIVTHCFPRGEMREVTFKLRPFAYSVLAVWNVVLLLPAHLWIWPFLLFSCIS